MRFLPSDLVMVWWVQAEVFGFTSEPFLPSEMLHATLPIEVFECDELFSLYFANLKRIIQEPDIR